MDKISAMQLNVLTLAYMGDVIHDLFVRSNVCTTGDKKINLIHKQVVSFVNANAQATAMDYIIDQLTDEELNIFKRGRNAKSTPPKNTDAANYKKATGFECVIGYLYLTGEDERYFELLNLAYKNLLELRSEKSV